MPDEPVGGLKNELEVELDHIGVGKVTLNGADIEVTSLDIHAGCGVELTMAVISIPLRKVTCKLPVVAEVREVAPEPDATTKPFTNKRNFREFL